MSHSANSYNARGGLTVRTIEEIIMTAPATTSKSAKAAPAKPAPAKAAKATPAENVAEKAEKKTYSATARCGKTNTRESATPLLFAVDLLDPEHTNRSIQRGAIVKMYATEAAAQAAADKYIAAGADAIVVATTEVN